MLLGGEGQVKSCLVAISSRWLSICALLVEPDVRRHLHLPVSVLLVYPFLTTLAPPAFLSGSLT